VDRAIGSNTQDLVRDLDVAGGIAQIPAQLMPRSPYPRRTRRNEVPGRVARSDASIVDPCRAAETAPRATDLMVCVADADWSSGTRLTHGQVPYEADNTSRDGFPARLVGDKLTETRLWCTSRKAVDWAPRGGDEIHPLTKELETCRPTKPAQYYYIPAGICRQSATSA